MFLQLFSGLQRVQSLFDLSFGIRAGAARTKARQASHLVLILRSSGAPNEGSMDEIHSDVQCLVVC